MKINWESSADAIRAIGHDPALMTPGRFLMFARALAKPVKSQPQTQVIRSVGHANPREFQSAARGRIDAWVAEKNRKA